MNVQTKRWDEPASADDGTRILITRFRPRALPKSQETWDEWRKEFAPSGELVQAFRAGELTWDVYRAKYLREMKKQSSEIKALADRANKGERMTLLCSSTCFRESRCHRSLLKGLIERAAASV